MKDSRDPGLSPGIRRLLRVADPGAPRRGAGSGKRVARGLIRGGP
jgi:hypothetical protein